VPRLAQISLLRIADTKWRPTLKFPFVAFLGEYCRPRTSTWNIRSSQRLCSLMLGAVKAPEAKTHLQRHTFNGRTFMLKLACTTAFVAVLSTAAFAEGTTQHAIPANSFTVADWYKQSVYDPKDAKIGEIMDVLVDKSGKVTSFIVGVGGFLGAGEKDVSVPFDAVRITTKDKNKWYLVMNTTKDELKSASGFTYDKDSTTWTPDKK
jgi:sporulation protein YlmC with PRC-barrel domain